MPSGVEKIHHGPESESGESGTGCNVGAASDSWVLVRAGAGAGVEVEEMGAGVDSADCSDCA